MVSFRKMKKVEKLSTQKTLYFQGVFDFFKGMHNIFCGKISWVIHKVKFLRVDNPYLSTFRWINGGKLLCKGIYNRIFDKNLFSSTGKFCTQKALQRKMWITRKKAFWDKELAILRIGNGRKFRRGYCVKYPLYTCLNGGVCI